MLKLTTIGLAFASAIVATPAFAGSVIVENRTDVRIEVCRAGGYAGCWAVEARSTKGPDYVQDDKPFWLNRPVQSRTFSVTGENERYVVEIDYDGNMIMRFQP